MEKLSEEMKVSSPTLPLYKLVEMRGGIDVTTEGTVIEIRDGSGYVERCPECNSCLLYTSPSPRDRQKSRMPSSA